MPQYQAPRGTQDVLPEDQPWWDYVRATAERLCRQFHYQQIETPMFEDASLFLRTVGDATDIVSKEMYLFEDRGQQQLALRPEGTAPVCRAYLEHGMANLPQPVRLWYWMPNFRYDRPQAGRYREHHQFGIEAIGDDDPAIDAEVIELLLRLYEDLGLSGLTLHLNSIGDPVCRPAYLNVLRAHYVDKLDRICNDCRQRYEKNALRLLDCKEELCQPVIAGAPAFTDHLCEPCAEHFERLKGYLDAVDIRYHLNPRLVRGLDYYTRTVFEVQPREEGGQSSLGGGGRYDGLIEQLGGKHTPGIGFGTGIERIIINLKRQEVPLQEASAPDVYVACATDGARTVSYKLASDLRRGGISAVLGSAERSLKAQLRHADQLLARFVAIIGERELADGSVSLKDLRNGSQITVPLSDVASKVAG
jgi:histidyl-tRNA synthetase